MTDAPPQISVLVAVRDMERFLPETLRSLEAQTLPDFETIAVDDGSHDGTGVALARFAARGTPSRPVTLFRTSGVGLAAARNQALAAAAGEFVMLLDGDDVLPPGLMARAVVALGRAPGADLAFPVAEHVDPDGAPLGFRSPVPAGPLTASSILLEQPIHTDSGAVVRARAARAAGGFDEALSGCVGLDFWCRILARNPGGALCLADTAVRYRKHPAQITGSAARMERNFHAFLDRGAAAVAPPGSVLRRHALARQRLFWASVAYAEDDLAYARALTAAAWRAAPLYLARLPYAYHRLLVSGASLLPPRWHDALRRQARRAVLRRRPTLHAGRPAGGGGARPRGTG